MREGERAFVVKLRVTTRRDLGVAGVSHERRLGELVEEAVWTVRSRTAEQPPRELALGEVDILSVVEEGRLVVGELVVDLDARLATVGGRQIPLSRQEFKLLATFASDPHRVRSPSYLMREVWEGDAGYLARRDRGRVAQAVSRLRSRLGPGWIESRHGQGWRLVPDGATGREA